MKKKFNQIIIAMWFVSIIIVVLGCLLSRFTSVAILLVGTGVYIALESEKVVNEYEH